MRIETEILRDLEEPVGPATADPEQKKSAAVGEESPAPLKKPEPRLYRVIWRWHFYAGLIVLPVLLTASVTGGLYVFREELERVIYPRLMFVEPQPQTVAYKEQLAKATAALPAGATVHGISISDDPRRATDVIAEIGPERYVSVYVSQHTGAVLGQLEYDRSLFGVILNIHRTLLAGTAGRLIVELATSWGVILIVTGLYLWWPRSGSKAPGVWAPRLRGKSYVIWRDWHTVPGFYLSLLAFLVMGTGLFFTLIFARGYQAVAHVANSYPASYLNPPKSIRKEGATRLGADDVIAVARREQSQKEMHVDFPHTAEDSFTVYAGSYDSPSTLTYLYIDQYSGTVHDAIRWRDISAAAKVQVSAYAIHIGSIYGLPTKILAVLVCLLIVVMSVTGAAMWWIRRPRGKTGFPVKPVGVKPAKWLIAVICLLGALMPAAGISMVLILAGDWLLRRWRRRRLGQAMPFLLSLAAVFALSSVPDAMAQKSTTSVSGHVYDQTGAVLPGATVRLTQPGGGFSREIRTDAGGAYRFDTLLIGAYELCISAGGFRETRLALNLAANYKREFDITLQPEGVSESVNVTATTEAFSSDVATTGTKMEMALRDVPQSIQVITRKVMDEQQSTTIADAVRNVSNVTQAPTFFGHSDHFVVRGFELDMSNSYFRDGFKYDQLGFQETADVEQVEVLKGPASVLYGRSEPGGIVNIASKTPLQNHYFSTQIEGGSFRFYRPTFDVSGPLNKKQTLLYRLNGVHQNSDHFRDFIFTHRWYAAPQLLWKIGDRTNVTIDGAFMRETGQSDFGIVGQGDRPVDVPWRLNFNEPWGRYKYQSRQGGYIFNHVFNDKWTLRNAFRHTSFNWYYFDTYQSYFADQDQLVRYIEDDDYPRRNLSSQTDLQGRFKFFGLEHRMLLGFEFARNRQIFKGKYAELPPINIFDFRYLEPAPPPTGRYLNSDAPFFDDASSQNRYRTIGGYAQDQITLHRTVKLLVGARWDDYQSRSVYLSTAFDDSDVTQSDFAASPRVGAVFQPAPALSLYFSYAKSFSPSFPTITQPNGRQFMPEYGRQYEGGAKFDLLDKRVSGSLAVYQLTKTNVITTDPNDPRQSIQVGEQRAIGAETDLSIRPASNWNLLLAYAWNTAVISKDTVFLPGSPMPNAARHVGSIWTTYGFERGKLKGLSLNLGLSGQSKRTSSLTQFDPATGEPSRPIILFGFARLDAGVSYRFKGTERWQYKLQFNLKNLLDRRYYESGRSNHLIMPAAPRTALASLQITFK
jgi:iron complex outermembrane receptor protein